MVKRILYLVGGIALLLGVWGFYTRLFVGEREVNYGSYVTWGLWVAMYLFFAGVATGAYMVASLDYLFRIPIFKGTGRVALWASMVTMPAALICIGMDLGHMERIWKVFLYPDFGSVMAQLVWGYSIFTVVTFATLILVLRNGNSVYLKMVMPIGLFFSVFLSGGVGALLGVNASRASWHTAMLPAQFPIFNLTSGLTVLLIVVSFFGVIHHPERRVQLIRVLSLSLIVLLVVKAYFLWVDYSQAFYAGVPHATDAIQLVLFGRYAWAFWVLQLGLGMVVPLVALMMPRVRRNGVLTGVLGVLILLGLAVARTSIVFPALAIPELDGLREAFSGPHLNYDYFPSALEWSVTLGVVGLATLAFVIGTDILPLFGKTMETES